MNENVPRFRFAAMSERDGEEICSWRYPPPYDVYQWPAWPRMLAEEIEFGDPDIRERQYASVLDENGDFVGYAQFFPMAGVIRLGLGLRPDCCGRGWGAAFLEAAAREAARRAPDAEIDLEVEVWNKRAIRAYQKAGFEIDDRYDRKAVHGIVSLYCMVRKSSQGAVR
ncbi:GNAT family N-acetyltransferase [Cohnella zeiphila]|uniref:GNAT family N-acetyltransferase n=1 Tax=Cohnella zeiphila TaxID=2761120 RepID=A0A7X0SRT9_9BACL|nr:GNAT family N-acetyltransferase [Cohnella zeiphila]MBB6733934.1 GNAT family N-acetyltransferase [Cohnella zeiphila]